MNIEEARKARGMSRKDVSRKLGIPYRSLENWKKGLSKCPDYVERLVVAEILRGGKKMTDIEVLMKNGYSKRKAEEVTPVMIARELNKMGYTEEELKKMKDVPETVMKDVLEKKEEWTR